MDKATQSKERISEALLALLKTTPYQSISIQMLADRADVSRMAFYRNFSGKEQIIQYYLQKQTDRFLLESQIAHETSFGASYFRKLVEHLSQTREIGKLLIDTGLFDLLRAEFDRIYTAKARGKQEKLRSCFLAGGICNVYYHWLSGGCQESPEELAASLERVLNVI
ncbi:MAG: TetR/AcrR family transcriptional regulator [Oscillospiraceae bacterium]|nr:TetR/AcrR family transcriptional regulator [Oscillospiraceae bacterium]